MARVGQDSVWVIGGDPRITPKSRNCLRDPDWTEISTEDFAKHPNWYVKTGTLRVNDELITFWDFNF